MDNLRKLAGLLSREELKEIVGGSGRIIDQGEDEADGDEEENY